MIFVDALFACASSARWPYVQACHLMGDDEVELHAFADRLGLRCSWYQPHDRIGH